MSLGLLRIRVLFRLFGLVIGFVSTAYFAIAFWMMMHGSSVRFVETNPMVIPIELAMTVTALLVLSGILVAEMVNYR